MGIEIELNKPNNTTEKTTEVDISKLDKSIEAAEEAAKKLEASPTVNMEDMLDLGMVGLSILQTASDTLNVEDVDANAISLSDGSVKAVGAMLGIHVEDDSITLTKKDISGTKEDVKKETDEVAKQTSVGLASKLSEVVKNITGKKEVFEELIAKCTESKTQLDESVGELKIDATSKDKTIKSSLVFANTDDLKKINDSSEGTDEVTIESIVIDSNNITDEGVSDPTYSLVGSAVEIAGVLAGVATEDTEKAKSTVKSVEASIQEAVDAGISTDGTNIVTLTVTEGHVKKVKRAVKVTAGTVQEIGTVTDIKTSLELMGKYITAAKEENDKLGDLATGAEKLFKTLTSGEGSVPSEEVTAAISAGLKLLELVSIQLDDTATVLRSRIVVLRDMITAIKD